MNRRASAMGLGLFLALICLMGALAVIRLAPSDPAVWHVDPDHVSPPATPNHWRLGADGDAPALASPLTPEALGQAIDRIALATPRTDRLAGDLTAQGGLVTYITRSALWGFPDYTSIKIIPEDTGAKLTLYARARFGQSDFGVNRARVTDWLSQLP